MLRITVERQPLPLTLRLEGKLIDLWVDELVRVWLACPDRAVRVDLNGVSFVDRRGADALAEMRRAGCQLTGSGPFIAELIAELGGNA